MIERTKKCEEFLKQKFAAEKSISVAFDFEAARQNIFDAFRRQNVLVESLTSMQTAHRTKLDEIQAKLDRFRGMREDLKEFKFEWSFDFQSDSYGHLNMPVNDLNMLITWDPATMTINAVDLSIFE